jgi:arylsulfatase
VRLDFEVKPDQRDDTGKPIAYGAGGTARIFVDGKKVAEGDVPRTMAFMYSLDETFDIGCDKGSPVTDEYEPLAAFTGTIIEVVVDVQPKFAEPEREAEAQVAHAMARQ